MLAVVSDESCNVGRGKCVSLLKGKPDGEKHPTFFLVVESVACVITAPFLSAFIISSEIKPKEFFEFFTYRTHFELAMYSGLYKFFRFPYPHHISSLYPSLLE